MKINDNVVDDVEGWGPSDIVRENRIRTLLQNLELNPPTGNIDEGLTRRWRRGGVDDDEVQISLSWLLKLPEISSSTWSK